MIIGAGRAFARYDQNHRIPHLMRPHDKPTQRFMGFWNPFWFEYKARVYDALAQGAT